MNEISESPRASVDAPSRRWSEYSLTNRAEQLQRIHHASQMTSTGEQFVGIGYALPTLVLTAPHAAVANVGKALIGGAATTWLGLDAARNGIKSWNLAYEVNALKDTFAVSDATAHKLEQQCKAPLSPHYDYFQTFMLTLAGAATGARAGLPGAIVGGALGFAAATFHADTNRRIMERTCQIEKLRTHILN